MRDRGFGTQGGRIFVCAMAAIALIVAAVAPSAAASTGMARAPASRGLAAALAAAKESQPKSTCAKNQIAHGVNGICLLNDIYSGYSAELPKGPWALGITGTWVVPEISCPGNIVEGNPRTAIWAGQWGSWTDLADVKDKGRHDAWLPQIGTVSRCLAGKPLYRIAWEMAADQAGYGNAAQDGMDCPGNKIYKLCAYPPGGFPNKPGKTMVIRPGDQILASVGILTGSQPEPGASPQPRKFQMYLDDLTTGVIADGYMETAKGSAPAKVSLVAIIDQSGVIIEDQSRCGFTDPFCSDGSGLNGLAKFTKPIRITAYIAQWKQYKTTVDEWVMQRDYLNIIHDQLARNSPPSGSMTGPSGMTWTVTWLRQY